MDPSKDWYTSTEIAEALSQHQRVSEALWKAADVWRVSAAQGTAERKRKGISPAIRGFKIVSQDREHSDDASGGNELRRMVKIQVASARGISPILAFIHKRYIPPKVTEEKNQSLDEGSQPMRGTAFEALSTEEDPFPSRRDLELWEAGFRAGVRSITEKNKRQPPPDRRLARGEEFWLTYEAWVILETSPAPTRKNLTLTAQLIASLAECGVKEADGKLVFPVGKRGGGVPMKLKTFTDNLTGWKKDFRALLPKPDPTRLPP